MQKLHSIGYLHVDLKPENILIADSDFEKAGSSLLQVIDFGLSVKYTDHQGNHIQIKRDTFEGNMIFCSCS